jgi:hypothetical protein
MKVGYNFNPLNGLLRFDVVATFQMQNGLPTICITHVGLPKGPERVQPGGHLVAENVQGTHRYRVTGRFDFGRFVEALQWTAFNREGKAINLPSMPYIESIDEQARATFQAFGKSYNTDFNLIQKHAQYTRWLDSVERHAREQADIYFGRDLTVNRLARHQNRRRPKRHRHHEHSKQRSHSLVA